MNPNDIDYYLDSPDWFMQQKYDGWRGIIIVGENVHYFPDAFRNYYIHSDITTFFESLIDPGLAWIFDIERTFEYCQKCNMVETRIIIFDMPMIKEDFEVRSQTLLNFMDTQILPHQIICAPVYKNVQDKRSAFQHIKDNNLEGVVFKHRDSQYMPDTRSKRWLKYKFTKTLEVVVLNVPLKTNNKNIPLRVGLHDNNSLVEVAKVPVSAWMATKLVPGRILEVEYYKMSPNNKLVNPKFISLRPDKTLLDATFDQLKEINYE